MFEFGQQRPFIHHRVDWPLLNHLALMHFFHCINLRCLFQGHLPNLSKSSLSNHEGKVEHVFGHLLVRKNSALEVLTMSQGLWFGLSWELIPCCIWDHLVLEKAFSGFGTWIIASRCKNQRTLRGQGRAIPFVCCRSKWSHWCSNPFDVLFWKSLDCW